MVGAVKGFAEDVGLPALKFAGKVSSEMGKVIGG